MIEEQYGVIGSLIGLCLGLFFIVWVLIRSMSEEVIEK